MRGRGLESGDKGKERRRMLERTFVTLVAAADVERELLLS